MNFSRVRCVSVGEWLRFGDTMEKQNPLMPLNYHVDVESSKHVCVPASLFDVIRNLSYYVGNASSRYSRYMCLCLPTVFIEGYRHASKLSDALMKQKK